MGLERVYGSHAVRAVLATRPSSIKRILIADGGRRKGSFTDVTEEYLRMVAVSPVQPIVLPWSEFLNETGLTKDDGHQGICVFTQPRRIYGDHELEELESARLVIALDQLSNPRNLGTILRSAAFFQFDALVTLRYRAAEFTPEVAKIAAGGAEFLKLFQVTNLVRALEKLKKLDYWIYGLEERGASVLSDTVFDRKTVLVVGAEGQGLRKKTRSACDFLVQIPGGREGLESLNAGVAASIAMADVSRRPFFQPIATDKKEHA